MYSKLIKTIFLTSIILSMGLTASAQTDADEKVRWKPIETGGKKITVTTAYIEFVPGASTFTGDTGCNRMSGTLSMGERSITIRPTMVTRRACKVMEGAFPKQLLRELLAMPSAIARRAAFWFSTIDAEVR